MRKINAYYKKNIAFALMLISALVLSSCGETSNTENEDVAGDISDGIAKIYYVNSQETALVSENYELTSNLTDTEAVIEELITQLENEPSDLTYEAPITGRISLIDYDLNDGILTLNFDSDYEKVEHVTEILDRAAMVRTLTQVDDVEYVSFEINSNPLTDDSGNLIGNMSADTFIYNSGSEINAYEKVTLVLYFTNSDGDKLEKVYRNVVYNSNISMERLATEQIIGGPNTDEVSPTINPKTTINSISVKDKICYVDFSSEFLVETYAVSPQVAVYSVVNTLCELTGVSKVQITVNGEKDLKFMDTIDLSNQFEYNSEILEEE